MSIMVGDGESQPTEGVDSLSQIGDMLGDEALDESEGEESEESEEEGEEEEEEEESEAEGKEEPTFTIKVDGKEVTLKQSELIETAQKGFDYTQKTMAVAEERKAVESEKARAAEYRQHAERALDEQIGRLEALEQFYATQVGAPPPIQLAHEDAASYLAQKELYEHRKGQLEQSRQAIQKLHDDRQRARQAEIVRQADATEKALRDTLPGWNDNTLNELAEYAGKLGLSPQNMDVGFVQKGFWELVHKAKQLDAILEKKAQLKPKADMPKVAKPKASNPISKPQADKARKLETLSRKPNDLASIGSFL